jgi:hypothetical protein
MSDLNGRSEILKVLEENIEKTLEDMGIAITF